MRIRRVDDFKEGDNFNTPYISGFDVLYERIALDMDVNADRYRDIELDLFARYDAYPDLFQREMEEYIQNWVDREYNFWQDYEEYLREYA